MEGWAVRRWFLVQRARRVAGERASDNENIYTRGDWVSVVYETLTTRTTTRHRGWHPARCVLSPGLCGTLWSHRDAVSACRGTPYALPPLDVAYRNGCSAFVCDCRSLPRPVCCTL